MTTHTPVTHGGHVWKLDSLRADGSAVLVRHIADAAPGWSSLVAQSGTYELLKPPPTPVPDVLPGELEGALW
ncbi:hypothetical protein ACWEQ4_01450 [Rhodococcus sp. NPDC003994]